MRYSFEPLTLRKEDGTLSTDQSFYNMAERYLDDALRLHPSLATVHGYHKYDHFFEDFSKGANREKTKIYEGYLKELKRVEIENMSLSAQIDYDIILNNIEFNLFNLKELKPHESDPTIYHDILGFGMLFLIIQDEHSPVWPERLQSILERMKQIPNFLNTAKETLKNPSLALTQFVMEQNPANITFFEQTLLPLFDKAPRIKEELITANEKAIHALKDYQNFLQKDLMARSDGDWRLGKDLWTKKLHLTLQSDMAPEKIIDHAWKMLAEERKKMLKVARPLHDTLFPGCKHQETGDALIYAVVREVINEVSKKHSTRETLFRDVRKWVDKIKNFIREKDIITLPPDSDHFVIERTPGFLDGLAFAFFNPAPAFEPQLIKSYWISSLPKTGNPEEDKKREESYFREYNDYGLQSITIHEAFPGHYVQYHYAQNSPIATIYKKVFPSGTFAEGWAILAEDQIYDNEYDKEDPANLLIHMKIKLRAPINAILDATLHTGSLKDEDLDQWALDLMMNHGFQEEAEAMAKLRRARVTSCQLSTYFVGYLELKDILDQYKKMKGAKFNLKEFNEKLLSFGTIPPKEVKKLLF